MEELASGTIPTWRRKGLISMPPPIPNMPPKIPAKNAITGKISFFDGSIAGRASSNSFTKNNTQD